nr:SulP family inorganic anion transporter [Pseudonocardia sp. KRD291]
MPVPTLPKLRPSRPTWLTPRILRTEVLAGLVVALALIPEAISFSIIAGVDPRVGLFASFTMAVTISLTGGRKAMISAATGAIALVVAPLSREYGLDYLIAAVLLGGVLQIVFALLGVARLMRFLPRMVMVGFVNALAILIFTAQLPYLVDVPWAVYPLLAAGLAIMVGLPRLTRTIPAPLVAIAGLTAFTALLGIAVPTVGDQGALPDSLPVLGLPTVPLTWQTLTLIGPPALAIALVGLIESLMTAKLVDEVTDTHSDKTRESWGQGVANIVTGLFGGMGGCAMIGQTMINVKSGARTRLSTFLAGLFLLILVVSLGPIVAAIPMAALVGVMIMVAVGTFDWHSIHPATLRRLPTSENLVMIATVAVTVTTHNLAYGVGVGVLVAMVLFARRVAHLVEVTGTVDPDGTRKTYRVIGQLFFASSNDLVFQFDYADDPEHVVIDLSDAHVWDASTVAALDAITTKYRAHGIDAIITGMNANSRTRHEALAGHLGGAPCRCAPVDIPIKHDTAVVESWGGRTPAPVPAPVLNGVAARERSGCRVLQIGEVATRVGLSLRTIRHWDEVGLVVPSARSTGGFRLYTEDDVERLQFIKTLKPLDLSLDQIKDLVSVMDAARAAGDSETADDLRGRLGMYRAAAEARIEALRAQVQGMEALSRELKSLAERRETLPSSRAVDRR